MSKSQVFYKSGGGDEQYTPRYAVEMALPYIGHLKDRVFWCPFDTDGSMFVRVLSENGFKVVYSSIAEGKDFFSYEPERWDVIFSNPPYTDKAKFMCRANQFGKPWAFLLPLNILSETVVNRIFGDCSELTMLMPDRRVRFHNPSSLALRGSQPTFKACYIGRNFFERQIIGVDLPEWLDLNDYEASLSYRGVLFE